MPGILMSQQLQFGISTGFTSYYGDLNKPGETPLTNHGLNIGVFSRIKTTTPYQFRVNGNIAQINLEPGKYSNHPSIKTNIYELNVLTELNFFKMVNINITQFYPYGFVGFGAIFFNPKGKYENEYVNLQPLGTEGQGMKGKVGHYSRLSPVIPFGVGLMVNLNKDLNIGFEYGFRRTFTDYLDDTGKSRINYLDLLYFNGPMAARMSNPSVDPADPQGIIYSRGGKYSDWYNLAKITIAFKIKTLKRSPKRKKKFYCPKF